MFTTIKTAQKYFCNKFANKKAPVKTGAVTKKLIALVFKLTAL